MPEDIDDQTAPAAAAVEPEAAPADAAPAAEVAAAQPVSEPMKAPAPVDDNAPVTLDHLRQLATALATDIGAVGQQHKELADAFVMFAEKVIDALKRAGQPIN